MGSLDMKTHNDGGGVGYVNEETRDGGCGDDYDDGKGTAPATGMGKRATGATVSAEGIGKGKRTAMCKAATAAGKTTATATAAVTSTGTGMMTTRMPLKQPRLRVNAWYRRRVCSLRLRPRVGARRLRNVHGG